MYLVKTPRLVQALWPTLLWNIPTREKVLYLTFDDGPIPEVTPWVLDTLAGFEAKATFFCVGENVKRHASVFQKILAARHSVGNHTYNHLNGWNTENKTYLNNVRRCAQVVKSKLFRPPYGKMLPRQGAFLRRHYRIVMWDVLSGDFDPALTADQCLDNVLQNAGPGSIIVFHDSLKSKSKLELILPEVLAHFAARGYRFEALPMDAVARSLASSKPNLAVKLLQSH